MERRLRSDEEKRYWIEHQHGGGGVAVRGCEFVTKGKKCNKPAIWFVRSVDPLPRTPSGGDMEVCSDCLLLCLHMYERSIVLRMVKAPDYF